MLSIKMQALVLILFVYITDFYKLNSGNTYNTTDVPDSSRVRGLSSGATGYIESRSTNTYTLSQTSGTFLRGEQVITMKIAIQLVLFKL